MARESEFQEDDTGAKMSLQSADQPVTSQPADPPITEAIITMENAAIVD